MWIGGVLFPAEEESMALFLIGLVIVVLGASYAELAPDDIDQDELIYYRTLKYYRQLQRDTLPYVKDCMAMISVKMTISINS